MKKTFFAIGMLSFFVFTGTISHAKGMDEDRGFHNKQNMMDDRGPGFGPRDFREGKDGPMRGPEEMQNPRNPPRFYIPAAIREVMDKYQVKMQKAFLEAKESRTGLDNKRMDVINKLDQAVDRYKTDKQASKDIVELAKQLNRIQDQLTDINEKAMNKIHALHLEREKAIRKARDNWFKNIESNPEELEKYINELSERPKFQKEQK